MPYEVFPVVASPYTEAPKFHLGDDLRKSSDVANDIATIYNDVRRRKGTIVASHVLQAQSQGTGPSIDTLFIVADVPTPAEIQAYRDIDDLDSGLPG